MQRPNYPSGKDLLSADAVSRFDLDDIIERAERHLHEEELEKAGLPLPEQPPAPRRRPKAVSYTHLDVYKRQCGSCAALLSCE